MPYLLLNLVSVIILVVSIMLLYLILNNAKEYFPLVSELEGDHDGHPAPSMLVALKSIF